jgi:hypothetical protein
MYTTCIRIRQRLNQLRLEKKACRIELKKEDISEKEIEELKECGYIVKEIKNNIIIIE